MRTTRGREGRGPNGGFDNRTAVAGFFPGRPRPSSLPPSLPSFPSRRVVSMGGNAGKPQPRSEEIYHTCIIIFLNYRVFPCFGGDNYYGNRVNSVPTSNAQMTLRIKNGIDLTCSYCCINPRTKRSTFNCTSQTVAKIATIFYTSRRGDSLLGSLAPLNSLLFFSASAAATVVILDASLIRSGNR